MSDPTNREERAGDVEGAQAAQPTDDASTSVTDHDASQPLVEDAAPSSADARQADADDWDRSWDEAGGGDIEPTVISPSALRGPAHDAEASQSSLEQAPDEAAERAADPATDDALASTRAVESRDVAEPAAPPELVEPRRPSLSLRGEQRPDLADTAPFAGLAATPEATQAMPAVQAEEPAPTQAMPVAPATEPPFEVAEPVTPAAPAGEQQQTQRLGSISVDDETARAAATGTPIVLVETPTPPRKKGARGVGFLVVLLATVVFGALLAATLAVEFLFERDFVLQDALQTLWLRPSWLLPVAVFLVAYWITTIVVNRAGWWAHVLGGFLVAGLTYAAHVAGAFLETQANVWDVTAIVDIRASDLGTLLLAPTAIVTFLVAREVPIWLGGIVARRGRRAKERNRAALEEYESEQARRLEEYESSRAS